MKAVAALLTSLLVGGCGSATSRDASNGPTHETLNRSEAPSKRLALGINMSTIHNWGETRPFMNLIYGSSWQMQNSAPQAGYEDVPPTSLDAHGWVKSVPAGYHVLRGLSVPLVGGNFVCRYRGRGILKVSGAAVSNLATSAGVTRFTLAGTYPDPKPALLSYTVDSRDYIRDIDCRESSASTNQALAPEFTSALAGFKVIRFMDWQTATGTNFAVSWGRRNKPGDGDYLRNDGVPVELIVETANEIGADPWVTIPWNADDDYIERFATYVRDNLASGRRVYVEVSNEVWNGGSPASVQACKEAKARKLPGIKGGMGCSLERYAEKTKQVMRIWSNLFAGHMNRLVRVASFQHVSPYWSNLVLGYDDLYRSIDAMATAPYFGSTITDSMTFNEIMAALPSAVDESVGLGAQQKAIAQKYGLRYVTYEGGQGIVMANNVDLERQVQRDSGMYDAYMRFLKAWQSQIGDELTLYNFAGGISRYGAWGLSEYVGQPVAQTPKMRAVRDFLGSAAAPGNPQISYLSREACLRQVAPIAGRCPLG